MIWHQEERPGDQHTHLGVYRFGLLISCLFLDFLLNGFNFWTGCSWFVHEGPVGLRVHGDPDYATLTKCSAWHAPLASC